MLLVCQEKSWYLTALVTGDKGPSLDPGHWEIDNRIDDIQGKFIPLYEVKGTQSHVNISKRDSLQILHSRKILIRLKLFNSAPLVVQFDMPPDALSIHERCGL
jgi:hypothetical protein